jgi:outer membrane receptor protein involved in Fe transport
MEDFFGKVDFIEEIPNTNLAAEKSINYEFGLKARHPWFAGNLFYFLSDYEDLIGRVEVDSLVQRQNIGRARIQGVELDFNVFLPLDLTLFGTYSWIEGTNLTGDEPLRRIPPILGTLGIRYQPTKRYWAEAWGLFAGRQDRLSPGDIEDERIPEGGTPGYAVFNLGGGVRIWDGLEGTLWVENLGDVKYKTHGSGIYFPGINVMIGCRYTF